MKTAYLIFLLSVLCVKTYSQSIEIHTIKSSRQPAGDYGYTLDGIRMTVGARPKLLNLSNFGPTGTYPKPITIVDSYEATESLRNIATVPIATTIFFFGIFNRLDPTLKPFSPEEVDSLFNWSRRGGKLIITSGVKITGSYEGTMLNNKWGFNWTLDPINEIIPTSIGNATDIFNGPFGNVVQAKQGGGAQGFFSSIPSNSKILGVNVSGQPTLYMDCNTLDLIVADTDCYTDLGGISSGESIRNDQDRFWANTIAFMDKLQPAPVITNSADNLLLNSNYVNYQWYLNGSPVKDAVDKSYLASTSGTYYVEVTLNGGCVLQSNTLIIDKPPVTQEEKLLIPTIFTPNNDGLNDFFTPVILEGIKIKKVSLFNRWGKLIHTENSPSYLWNGKIKNETATDGVYYWIIEYVDLKGATHAKNGFVQLIK